MKRILFLPDAHTRFMNKVIVDSRTWCAIWIGAVDKDGYPIYRYSPTKQGRGHRFSYEQCKGPIPKGSQIDHLCRNRACVNAAHLEIVSPKENTLRGYGPAGNNARKIECINHHPFSKENTRVRPNGGRDCKQCKREVLRRSRARRKACQP